MRGEKLSTQGNRIWNCWRFLDTAQRWQNSKKQNYHIFSLCCKFYYVWLPNVPGIYHYSYFLPLKCSQASICYFTILHWEFSQVVCTRFNYNYFVNIKTWWIYFHPKQTYMGTLPVFIDSAVFKHKVADFRWEGGA